ncbi:MAG: hypothetical protein FJ118_11295 [Deltaproteobacteria bacterium]|nr:hypothetical protein [Deltaproteobacteria bacterium]
MDEGVDPRAMCRSLVEKISQSEQLRSVADPELLVLFEDWLEELESEALRVAERSGAITERKLAGELGLTESGALFLIKKLKRDGKI